MNQEVQAPANNAARVATELNVTIDRAGTAWAGTMVNLSAGGCCLNAPAATLRDGDLVQLSIPTSSGNDLCLGAVVRWTARHLAGVEFQQPDGDQAVALEVLLAQQRWLGG